MSDKPLTTEQKIRGGDAVADWIFLVSGYDSSVLETVSGVELGPVALEQAGALPSATASVFRLSYALAANDL
jgi:hypothetical protein